MTESSGKCYCRRGIMPKQQRVGILLAGYVGVVWGALGVFGILVFPIYRLAPRALAAYDGGLTPGQWLLAGLTCVFMAYAEGYRGFQTRFSPRTAARIRYLRDRPNVTHSLFAPLFSMGFFHAARRTKITAYGLSVGILILVVLVQRLDQPWRGIIDAGVVLGLSWGVLSLGWSIAQALTRPSFDVSPEVPTPGVNPCCASPPQPR